MSGPQSEGWLGKRHENIMDTWYRICRNDFYKGVGPDVASDFLHHFENDFRLMKEIGLNSFRTSIQWTRLIANLETGELDPNGIAFYQAMIRAAKANEIKLIFNLHHFDLPTDLLDRYAGWESRHVVDLFVKYAKTAFQLFKDEIHEWTTFNEPMVMIDGGYLYGYHYPHYKNEGKRAVQVLYHIVLANALVTQAYHQLDPEGKIGIIVNVTPAYPRSDRKEDQEAARFFDLFHWRSFLDASIHGHFPDELVEILRKDGVLWKAEAKDESLLSLNRSDFIGINYYHPTRVQATEGQIFENWLPDQYYAHYDWPEKRVDPYKDWEIFPKALYDIAKEMTKRYPKTPWFVSETGIGVHDEGRFRNKDGVIEDLYRINFYKEHLFWLHKAIKEGASCFGFHTWAALDCWSWNNAYKNRYGFIEVDLNDQTRTIKKSGRWYRQVSLENGFEIEEDPFV